jgi:rhamnosyltransferase
MNMTAAIIVLYYPQLSEVERLISALDGQVDGIFVLDNTPVSDLEVNQELLQQLIAVPVRYRSFGKNLGIAQAQNIGITEALADGVSRVVLFDQDSNPGGGMIDALIQGESELITRGMSFAAVGPAFIESETGKVSPAVRYTFRGLQTVPIDSKSVVPVESHFLISSGTLIRRSALEKVGLMNAELFIDWVDNEWCLRARQMRMFCYIIPNAKMHHKVGDGVKIILGKTIHLHTETRNYFLLRNAVFLMRSKSMGWRWKVSFLPRMPIYILLYPLLAKHKARCLLMIIRGLLDGLTGRLGSNERIV